MVSEMVSGMVSGKVSRMVSEMNLQKNYLLNQNVPSDLEIKMHQQIAVDIQKVNIFSAFTKVTMY